MDIKTQIVGAVISGLVGILLGIFMVTIAACYRRRRVVSRTRSHGVHYRKRSSRRRKSDTVSIYFGERRNRNSRNLLSSTMERIAEESNKDNYIHEVELRPKVHQAKWNRQSKNIDSKKLLKKNKELNQDFTERRRISFEMRNIPRPLLRLEENNEKLRDRLGSDIGLIPRPSIRPYRSELFETRRSKVYESHNRRSSQRSSSIEFY